MYVNLSDEDVALAQSWAKRVTGTRVHHDYGMATIRHSANEESVRFISYCAELAVARFLSLPWREPEPRVIPDVGTNVSVRWSAIGKLIIRERDPGSFRYYLVTSDPPNMSLRGFMVGDEARQPGYWRNEDEWAAAPAWVVPADHLHPVSHLCGWARTESGFQCVADYSNHREPGCGAVWGE